MRALVVSLGILTLAAPAAAQRKKMGEIDVDRGPTSELYIRKRPPIPEAPVLTSQLKDLLRSTETRRDQKRLDAIAMLKALLASDPIGETRADAMFKLAELLWEEARRQYLIRMEEYGRVLEGCSRKRDGCDPMPAEPRIQLAESERLYKQLLAENPDFRRADIVTYLIGFAAKEDMREAEALQRFIEVTEKYPDSPMYGDAWMMIGEHHFQQAHWDKALSSYANIGPDAPTYDIALFKTAWCQWKLSMLDEAMKSFMKVLDLNEQAKRGGTAQQQRRRQTLGDEALEYLVVMFTEDRSVSAREVFDFLASIGGEKYSRDVLIKVAESYSGQSEYERANDTYAFLIDMDPSSLKAAEYQRAIVENWNSGLEPKRAQEQITKLLTTFGPGTDWALAQRNKDALARSLDLSEKLVRVTARNLQADAQNREKGGKCKVVSPWMLRDDQRQFLSEYLKGGLKRCGPEVVPLFKDAAAAYDQYLGAFGTGRTAAADSVETRFLRGQILFFKLGELEAAGDEFMAVGKSAPIGKYHQDALRTAMDSYELARPTDTAGRKQLYPVDKKFGEAMDLYATLFPGDDKELTTRIFKNGKMFFDYQEYDEAIKRFGLIVTKYPDDPNAGPAGDHILEALIKGKDFENIEEWARKLKKVSGFQTAKQQAELDRMIIQSIAKSGDKYKEEGEKAEKDADPAKRVTAGASFQRAAAFYLRVPKEFPNDPLAVEKMMNAGVMYEKAKLPERAADVYLELAAKFPSTSQADKSAFAAGVVYENVVYFDRAADTYELVVKKFPRSSKKADALFNAGRLRQALGQYDKAIKHYRDYAALGGPDAEAVQFNIGVVAEETDDLGRAYSEFTKYAGSANKRVVEARVRAGRAAYKGGKYDDAAAQFKRALKEYDDLRSRDKTDAKTWAAEATYYQGDLVFRQFERIKFDVKPRELTRVLKKKVEMLEKAKAVYVKVADYNDPKWATAALFRTGQVYDSFAEALIAAPTPPGLNPAEADAYRGALDAEIVQIQETAVEHFAAGYKKAIEMQIYDQYTAKMREALGRLAADKFPPEREGRARERIGDSPLGLELVTEVVR